MDQLNHLVASSSQSPATVFHYMEEQVEIDIEREVCLALDLLARFSQEKCRISHKKAHFRTLYAEHGKTPQSSLNKAFCGVLTAFINGRSEGI